MDETNTTETAADATPSPGLAGTGGSVEDIMADLGLEPETEAERNGTAVAAPAAGDKEAATAQAKGDDDKTDDDGPEASKADTDAAKDMAEWLAVRKRAAERRNARRTAAAAPAPQAAAPPAAVSPAAAATPAKDSEIKTAVADIIAALGALDDADDAGGTPDAAGLAKKALREADLATIKEKLGVVAKAVEDSAAVKDKYGELEKDLRGRLQEIQDTTFVEGLAEQAIERMEDKLPHLSKHRNASKLVVQFASDFLERKGKAAPLGYIAEKVEAVLARRAQEKNGAPAPKKNGAAPEKQHPSRKTVSSDLATPPSRRQGADQRTPQQVEADLWTSLGLDPDA